jgi:hypothetical protein
MKIIIENRTKLDAIEALKLVSKVVELGKVSETSKGKQYCFASRMVHKNQEYMVYSDKNKKSDRFVIDKS